MITVIGKNMDIKRSSLKRASTLPLIPILPGSHPPPVLCNDTLDNVRNEIYRTPYRLERLEALMAWCETCKVACDDDLYRDVVTRSMGAPVKGDIPIPEAANLKSMFCSGADSYGYIGGKLEAYFTTDHPHNPFWKFFAWHCFNELSMLPTSMCTAFLNSNNAQRRRWNKIFRNRKYYWLMARTELGSVGIPEVLPLSEEDIVYKFFHGHDMIERVNPDEIFYQAKQKIENGWLFDSVLDTTFSIDLIWIRPQSSNIEDIMKATDPTTNGKRHEESFRKCVEFFIGNGIDPTITSDIITFSLTQVEIFNNKYSVRQAFMVLHNHYVAIKLKTIMDFNLFVYFRPYKIRETFEFIHKSILIDSNFDEYREKHGGGAYYSLSETLYHLIIYLGLQTGSNVANSGLTAAFRVPTSHEELLQHVNDNRTRVIDTLNQILSNDRRYPGDADSAKRLANAAMISEKLRYLDGEDWNVTLPREDQQLEHV